MLPTKFHPARELLRNTETRMLWDDAARWYKLPRRHYHNLTHADAVATALVIPLSEVSPTLLLAARWHDAVYIPGAANGANEEASAAALLHVARERGYGLELPSAAAELIRQTTIRDHLRTTKAHGDIAMLLDADLSGLATNYPKFVANQKAIYQEHAGLRANRNSLAGSAEWLHALTTRRPYIFHTDVARACWEKAARNNIRAFVTEFGNTAQRNW